MDAEPEWLYDVLFFHIYSCQFLHGGMDIAISEANNGKQQILFIRKTKLTQGGTSRFCTQRLGVPIANTLMTQVTSVRSLAHQTVI